MIFITRKYMKKEKYSGKSDGLTRFKYLLTRCLVVLPYKKIFGVQLLSSHLPECEEFCTHDSTPPSPLSSLQIFLSASY